MGLDTSIYNALMAPQKSAMDYANEREASRYKRNEMKMEGQKNALLIRQAQQEYDDDQAVRSALSRVAPDAPLEARVGALRATGLPGGFKAADALEASKLKADRDREELAKTKAETGKIGAETQSKQADRLRIVHGEIKKGLGYVFANPTREAAEQAIAQIEQAYGVPLDAYRQQVAQMQTPDQIKQWAMGHSIEADKQADMLQKQAEFKLKQNNELIGADGKVNSTLYGLQIGKARAGASNVNINTGQKGLDNEFKLRGEFKQEPVYKAHQEMQAAHGQIKQAIAQASPAGDLAAATKIMKLLDPGSVVRESELGMAMQASGLLDRVQNYASNVVNGTKLTPKQREDFQQLADRLYSESVNSYNSKRGEYEKLGGEYGLNAPRALGPTVNMPKQDQTAEPAGKPSVSNW